MKALGKVGLLAALLAGWSLACDRPSHGAAPRIGGKPGLVERPGDDVQDVIFLSEARPLLLRLHVRIDGKPYKVVWEQFMDKLFRYLDTNGDGMLSRAEADRAPPVQTLFNTGFFGGGGGGPSFAAMDTNRDGQVSRAELAEFYRRNGAAPFQFNQSGGRRGNQRIFRADTGRLVGAMPSADALNQRLFDLLDKNKDGKLSRAELVAAPAILSKFDADDDEMLTAAELMGNALPGSGVDEFVVATALTEMNGRAGPGAGPFHVVTSDRGDAALSRRLLSQYGTKGARKLTAKQLGLDKETFDRLDADGDGELDVEELARFARRAPDLAFIVRVGKRDGAPLVEQVKRGGKPSPADRYVVKGKTGLPVLDVNNTRVDLGGMVARQETRFAFDVRQQYTDQFKAADKDNNGYLDEAEARQSPLFRGTFKMMDRDGDGMLYLKEVLAYLDTMKDLSAAGMASIVSLSVTDQGRGLFDLLDGDRDGRLSVREVRQLPKLIDLLDRDGDGMLAKSEIPRSYRASFDQGPSNVPQGGFQVVAIGGGMAGPPLPRRTAGPLWFRKMDRNRDGDVSRREFLGTEEELRKIDTDGDGLISVEEATAYDRLKRAARKE